MRVGHVARSAQPGLGLGVDEMHTRAEDFRCDLEKVAQATAHSRPHLFEARFAMHAAVPPEQLSRLHFVLMIHGNKKTWRAGLLPLRHLRAPPACAGTCRRGPQVPCPGRCRAAPAGARARARSIACHPPLPPLAPAACHGGGSAAGAAAGASWRRRRSQSWWFGSQWRGSWRCRQDTVLEHGRAQPALCSCTRREPCLVGVDAPKQTRTRMVFSAAGGVPGGGTSCRGWGSLWGSRALA